MKYLLALTLLASPIVNWKYVPKIEAMCWIDTKSPKLFCVPVHYFPKAELDKVR